jgi:ArsR family transcriptional regulator
MDESIRLLRALSDPARLRLMRLLQHGELCVCELVETLRMPQYAVSRHLRLLRALGLVEARRDGRWMYYRLGSRATGPRLSRELLAALARHLDGTRQGQRDDQNLRQRMARGRIGRCLTAGS